MSGSDSVERDGQQQHGRLNGFDRVPLRRYCNQVTGSKLGVGLISAEDDPTTQAEQRSVPRTLVLAHRPLGRKRHNGLPEPRTTPAVDRD